MYPEDRVLVGVINRRRDLTYARQGWYRIPAGRYVWREAEYLAFFLSRAFGDQNGAVRWVAAVRGWELTRRRDLLPAEADHPRADDPYYRIAIGELAAVQPPILNARGRTVAFIHTTGAAFSGAQSLADLSGHNEYAVTRIYRRDTPHGHRAPFILDHRRGDRDF